MSKINTIIGISDNGVATMFDNNGQFIDLNPNSKSVHILGVQELVLAINTATVETHGEGTRYAYGESSCLLMNQANIELRAPGGVHLASQRGQGAHQMVLGGFLVLALEKLIDIFINNTLNIGTANGEPVALNPGVAAQMKAWVQEYVRSGMFLSEAHTLDRGEDGAMFLKDPGNIDVTLESVELGTYSSDPGGPVEITFNEDSTVVDDEVTKAFESEKPAKTN